jgi:hypothetical protein
MEFSPIPEKINADNLGRSVKHLQARQNDPATRRGKALQRALSLGPGVYDSWPRSTVPSHPHERHPGHQQDNPKRQAKFPGCHG